jgi:hypothetical protein
VTERRILEVVWQGRMTTLRPDSVVASRYRLFCPKCGNTVYLNVGPGGHTMAVDHDGRPTISPTIACPHACGWRVRIEAGIAHDQPKESS